ncbi:O-sialoglycoprotein endopeptidase [Thermodesulfobium narugense DSM 14796]|uniref:tRNA N6-adenosine threonylcarbamoyltransferase n=1 Tax=Thermodesulfobium narugense DSM 14796 TaxID=747365 RepID=M1E8A0_9BACT|nr:tRNA (adenosine(37)-N6)-threonylcarbamoyltransferase complex transferase subunit TsaD [Thermodesulfobium narugense]AEE15063.1 O-sialoglycoprotein endopeptidase [Thermodesulfobium narugense DSM 14796]
MIVLGIETSCDDTGIAVVKDGSLICEVRSTQEEVHKKFGGVVPEVASREHFKTLLPLYEIIKEKFSEKIDVVAVTVGPGLPGSLSLGLCFAKTIALCENVKIVGVNHLEAHLLACLLEYRYPKFPTLGVIVSGGHTEIILWSGWGVYERIGWTVDDAIGEVIDKIGREMGISYPAGSEIERLSQSAKGEIKISRLKMEGYMMSFSGIKTAALREFRKISSKEDYPSFALGLQNSLFSSLSTKIEKVIEDYQIKEIVLGGGVAANGILRNKVEEICKKYGLGMMVPSPKFCADNAAMVAICGYDKTLRGISDDLSLDYRPDWKI